MDYSPRAEIQTVSRVDAGTVELVRSMGAEVVSSAELVAALGSVLSQVELDSQARASAQRLACAQHACCCGCGATVNRRPSVPQARESPRTGRPARPAT